MVVPQRYADILLVLIIEITAALSFFGVPYLHSLRCCDYSPLRHAGLTSTVVRSTIFYSNSILPFPVASCGTQTTRWARMAAAAMQQQRVIHKVLRQEGSLRQTVIRYTISNTSSSSTCTIITSVITSTLPAVTPPGIVAGRPDVQGGNRDSMRIARRVSRTTCHQLMSRQRMALTWQAGCSSTRPGIQL